MKTTRQGPIGLKGGDNLIIQQLMQNSTTLKESVAAFRAEQAHREEHIRIELDALCVTNAKLRKTNKELRKDLQRLEERFMG